MSARYGHFPYLHEIIHVGENGLRLRGHSLAGCFRYCLLYKSNIKRRVRSITLLEDSGSLMASFDCHAWWRKAYIDIPVELH